MEGTNNINSFSSRSNGTQKLRIQPYCEKQGDLDFYPTFFHKTNIQMEKYKYPCSLIKDAHPTLGANLTLEKEIKYELEHGRKLDPNMDEKKIRRTISNRLAARRSRRKKSQSINDLQKKVNDLQGFILSLTSQIEIYKEKRKMLQLENNSLQKLVEISSNESKLHEVELEKKKNELTRLNELEKLLNKDCHGSSSTPQQIQDLCFSSCMAQSYPDLGFYQVGLQQLQNSLGSHQVCERQLTNSMCVQPEQIVTSKQPAELLTSDENQDEANIDQYLNFDALNVHPHSG